MSNYLLISSDAQSLIGRNRPAARVAAARLNRKLWPLYHRTSFSKILAAGDTAYIYAAGTSEGGGSIIGRGVIAVIEPWESRHDWFEHDDLLVDAPSKIIRFRDVQVFPDRIPLRPMVGRLDLTRQTTKNWGAFMQGGCKRLSEKDIKIIKRTVK